jgi:ankyrin repeat protein
MPDKSAPVSPSVRRALTLAYLAAASYTYGCAHDPAATPQTSNSVFRPPQPFKTPSLDERLFEVAGEPGFKEEPDDPAATLLLLNAGANVNARDSVGVPVLTLAVRNGRIKKVAKTLLDHGADVNAQDDGGQTALMQAAGFSDPKMVRLLLDYKVDPNIKDADGFTVSSGSEVVGGSNDPDYLAVRRMLKKAGAK